MPAKKKNRQRPAREDLRSPLTRKPPAFVTPMAAQVVKRLPEGDDWTYELKFDGYRALIIKDGQRVRAPVEEEQGPRRDVSGNRGGRLAGEGRPGGDRR